MKKLFSLAVSGAVVLAACGGGSSAVAATVDGSEITVGDVEALMDAGGATVTREQFAQFLSFAIQWEAIFSAAESEFGITVSDDEVAAQAESLYEDVALEGISREEFLTERGITEQFLTMIAHQSVLLDDRVPEVLIQDMPDPTPDELEGARRAALAALTEACVSHILVDTVEEAEEALERLEDGEEFGQLAQELSTDVGTAEENGILPCTTLDTYVDPFRDAALVATVGEVLETPVQSTFGYHIILVTDRTEGDVSDVPPDEELAESIRESNVMFELDAWALGAVESATVTVEEEYGTWSPSPPGVTPPVD